MILEMLLLATFESAEPRHAQRGLKELREQSVEKCIVAEGQGTLLEAQAGRNLIVERRDRNGDGVQDLLLAYEVLSYDPARKTVTPKPFPVVYLIDDDFDGNPDRQFLDFQGNGICADIKQVPLDFQLGGRLS